MTPVFQTPDWVKNAVFYQIFPDRFAFSPSLPKPGNLEPWDAEPTMYCFKGGDLLGVLERLDYLQDLGINAIYFNPIFQSASNHRYHTHDYFRVDPLLGGGRAFRLLLDEAHRRGIYIVLDGVFNHASRGFFQFNHILETGPQSPYLDWFTVHDFPLNAYSGEPRYECWEGLPALPKFNTANPQVREFIFSVARYWLEQGIDGWRLDVPFEIDDDAFWQQFRQVVKGVNPQAYIVGEVPWEAQRWLQGDQFDAVMNYQFTQACLGFFAAGSLDRSMEQGMMGLPSTPVLDAAGFARRTTELLEIYPHEAALAQLNLLGSHDMPRFAALAGGDQAALRLAVLFQMTYPGAPCIYYGDEIGMAQGQAHYPEASRWAFPWDPTRWDHDLRDDFKRCIALRRRHPALRTGSYQVVHAQGQHLAFLRALDDERLLVLINNDQATWQVDIPANGHLPDGCRGEGLLDAGSLSVQHGRLTGISLPPRSGAVFACRPQP